MRWMLTGIAVLFLGVFIFMPLAVVFAEALRKGLAVYWDGLTQPDALAAIKLTLIAAGIAVPLNVVFGVAAAWAIGKFEFWGKSLLITSDRSSLLGLAGGVRIDLRFAVWIARRVRTMAGRA